MAAADADPSEVGVVLAFDRPRQVPRGDDPRPHGSAALSEPDSPIRTIVLNPGHGGVHAGARGPNGLLEAEDPP